MKHAADGVDVSLALDREQIVRGRTTSVHAVARIRVPSGRAGVERAPLSVVLALDVSASMAGDPLRHVVRSAERLAALLREGDRLGVVAFSAAAFEVAPLRPVGDAMRLELGRALRRLQVQSQTNVEAGLRAAHELAAQGPPKTRTVVLLLSDGQPNVGRCRPVELASIAQGRPAATATLGYGPNHDDHVLGAIADAGRGRYAYIPDPQLAQVELARALGAESEAVVEGVEVRLAALPDTRLEWVVGPSVELSGNEAKVRVPDLAAGADALVAARLSVTGQDSGPYQPLVDIAVSYRAIGNGDPRCILRRLTVGVGRDTTPARPAVLRAALVAEASQRRREACTLADQGQFDEAVGVLDDIRARVVAAPGVHSDDELSESLEQLVDDIDLMRKRPDRATYASFRRGQREVESPALLSPAARAWVEDAAGDIPLAELVVQAGPCPGAVYPLRGNNVLGRTSAADIPLSDASVSRRHACVMAAHGTFWLVDLGSTNTTHVNGRPIDKHRLAPGDEIQLGTWRLLYRERAAEVRGTEAREDCRHDRP